MSEPDVLANQQSYYRARAPEYDEWWQRAGRYDTGPEGRADWEAQVERIEGALTGFGPSGDVLELAGGTGWWTQRLARSAATLTVVDGSEETIEVNRARVGRADVDYVIADIFQWRPTRTWDNVFFSFWLSHVPRPRFADFWALVAKCLAPGGRVFFIDSRAPDSHSNGPAAADLQPRRLNDGRTWQVVKIYYEPAPLTALLAGQGFEADLSATRFFIYGSTRPTEA